MNGSRASLRALPFVALLALAIIVPGVSVATGMPWSGSTYRGHGTGLWHKDTAMLKVSGYRDKRPDLPLQGGHTVREGQRRRERDIHLAGEQPGLAAARGAEQRLVLR